MRDGSYQFRHSLIIFCGSSGRSIRKFQEAHIPYLNQNFNS